MTNQIETFFCVNPAGVQFVVLAIPASVEGPNAFRAPAGREHATVEFYDERYPECARGEEPGQFISSYRVSTLLDEPVGYYDGTKGLNLSGGVPDWQVDAANMLELVTCLEAIRHVGLLD